MAQGKIELSLGALSFSGEGDEVWLAAQLDKVLSAAPSLSQLQPPAARNEHSQPNLPAGAFNETLPSYIKAKGAETNQNQRFLVTADWLRRRSNAKLTTAMVSKALSDYHQKRLGNAAECLNQNVGKGYCEKTPDGFYITPDGLKHLGN